MFGFSKRINTAIDAQREFERTLSAAVLEARMAKASLRGMVIVLEKQLGGLKAILATSASPNVTQMNKE